MRDTATFHVHVLILSVSVFVVGCLVTTENQESGATTGDQAAALLQAGAAALHRDHVARTQSSSARSGDMSRAVEELDFGLAVDAEVADLARKHSAPIVHAAPRKVESLALTQQSSGQSSDMSRAVEELDLQLAIHAELAEVNTLQTRKEAAATAAHQAAALLQSGHNALQGEHERSHLVKAVARSKTATEVKMDTEMEEAEMEAEVEMETEREMKAERDGAVRLANRNEVTTDLSSHRTASAANRASRPHFSAANRQALAGALPSQASVAGVGSTQGSTAGSGNVPHAAQVVAVHTSDILQKTLVLEPPSPPSALRSSHGNHGHFDSWTSEYKIFGRERHVSQYFVKGFISVLVWAALTMLIGCFYHHEKQHPPKMDPEGVNVSLHDRERLDRQRWRFGLFECAEVPSLCLFSLFCAPIRWADTMRMAGFMNFFSGLALVVGLTVLGSLTLGIGFLFLLGACVRFRHHMRKQFDIRSGLCGVYTDALAYIFCPLCSIVQEARQVEEAYLARHASVRGEYIMARLAASKV